MSNDDVIHVAQRRFGADGHLGSDVSTPVTPPGWIVERAAEETYPIQPGDTITAEASQVPRPPRALPKMATADVLAFYLPFHFYRTEWGIYIRASGLWSLADRLAAGRPDITALNTALSILLEHERFHFVAEYAASRIEVVTGQSHYAEYFKSSEGRLHEEAVANASSFRSLQRRADSRMVRAAAAWMRSQPDGYRDFEGWLLPRVIASYRRAVALMTPAAAKANRDYSGESPEVKAENALSVLNNTWPPSSDVCAWHPAEFVFRNTSGRRVPTLLVFDGATAWMRIAKPFPKDYGIQVFVRTHDHKPAHIHIESPPGTNRTAYTWPALTPLRNKPTLRSTEEKRLRQYIERYGKEIDGKVNGVRWE